jgi:hypothetical protein
VRQHSGCFGTVACMQAKFNRAANIYGFFARFSGDINSHFRAQSVSKPRWKKVSSRSCRSPEANEYCQSLGSKRYFPRGFTHCLMNFVFALRNNRTVDIYRCGKVHMFSLTNRLFLTLDSVKNNYLFDKKKGKKVFSFYRT